METIPLLRKQIEDAHGMLQGTMQDVTSEHAAFAPGGKAIAAGPTFAHIVLAEDFFLNMVVGRQPLGMGAFAGKTGLSEQPPMGGAWDAWARGVKVDLPALREYGAAVFKATEEYTSSLKAEDLDREIDLSNAGLGKMSLGGFLSMLAVIHTSSHCGEISCLKGLQGAKGYPF